jgi:hypothetical protein
MAGMLRSMDVNLLAHLATFVRDRLGETVPPPDGVAEAALEARLLNLQTAVLDLNTSMINVPPAPQPPEPTTDMTRTGLLDAQIAAGTYAFVATGGAPGAGSTPWRTRSARRASRIAFGAGEWRAAAHARLGHCTSRIRCVRGSHGGQLALV